MLRRRSPTVSAIGRSVHLPARYGPQPSAKPRALHTSLSRSALRTATRRPRCAFDTVATLCRLTAHGPFIPSTSVRRTSDGTSRIVEVMGATVTADKYAIALSRVSTSTGRCLSGRAKRYSRISPRSIAPATLPPAPSQQLQRSYQDAAGSPGDRELPGPASQDASGVREAPCGLAPNGLPAPAWRRHRWHGAVQNPTQLESFPYCGAYST